MSILKVEHGRNLTPPREVRDTNIGKPPNTESTERTRNAVKGLEHSGRSTPDLLRSPAGFIPTSGLPLTSHGPVGPALVPTGMYTLPQQSPYARCRAQGGTCSGAPLALYMGTTLHWTEDNAGRDCNILRTAVFSAPSCFALEECAGRGSCPLHFLVSDSTNFTIWYVCCQSAPWGNRKTGHL